MNHRVMALRLSNWTLTLVNEVLGVFGCKHIRGLKLRNLPALL